MITKNDWDDALDAWVAEERERLGGPPDPEEVAAFVSGQLSEKDAARVEALLVYYPELTLLLDERIERAPARFRFMPLAAGLVIAALSGLLVQSRVQVAQLRQPYAFDSRPELQSTHVRGTGTAPVTELPSTEDRYLLTPTLTDAPRDPAYRIEIVDLASGKVVWKSGSVQPVGRAFDVVVPRGFLKGDVYRLDVYGVDGARAHVVEQFRFRAPQKRSGGIF